MMFFVDIQGFKEFPTNRFILKEFALIPESEYYKLPQCVTFPIHFTIKPPYSFVRITNSKMVNNVKWLTSYHHGIYWNSGTITINQLKKILYQTFFNINTKIIIKLKGNEKEKWMNDFFQQIFNNNKYFYIKNVENIHNLNFQKLSLLRTKYPEFKCCKYHMNNNHLENTSCALNNVCVMREYVRENYTTF